MRAALHPPRAPLAGALAVSIAAHVAAFVLLRAPQAPEPAGPKRMSLRLDARPAQPAAGGPASATATQATGAALAPAVQRMPEVVVSATRVARPIDRIASAGERAAQGAAAVSPGATVTAIREAEPDRVAPPAVAEASLPAPAPVVAGVSAFAGFGIDGFGVARPRFSRGVPRADAAPVALRDDHAPRRAALEAQVAESRLVGALLTQVRTQVRTQVHAGWSALDAGAVRCEVRRAETGPVATCAPDAAGGTGAIDALLADDALPALLERVACVVLEWRDDAVRVDPCPADAIASR